MTTIWPFEVSVCVCTFKRPNLLLQLLESLANQTFPTSSFEVIVVDNDKHVSAKAVIYEAKNLYPALNIRYDVEPTPGISYARNKTVALATGNYLAFIDDDEWAVNHWLIDLMNCLANSQCDAVFGPVLPHYPNGTRNWVIQSGFFERPRFPTGTSIKSEHCRTGNALVKGLWLRNRQPLPFDLRFAQSGGEDFDFFKWVEHQGGKFVWADTAEVNEEVLLDRQRLSYIFERCLRTSFTYWRNEYAANTKLWVIRKATIGFIGGSMYFLMGCFLLPLGFDHLVRQWSKGIKGFARIAALSNLVFVGYSKKNE